MRQLDARTAFTRLLIEFVFAPVGLGSLRAGGRSCRSAGR